MRGLTFIALLAAFPAVAQGIPQTPRWSIDVHELHPDTNLGTFVTAEPMGRGWRLRITCETTDTIQRRVIARSRYEGLGVRIAELRAVVGVMNGGRSRITLSFDGDMPILMTSYAGCPNGPGNLSTGD